MVRKDPQKYGVTPMHVGLLREFEQIQIFWLCEEVNLILISSATDLSLDRLAMPQLYNGFSEKALVSVMEIFLSLFGLRFTRKMFTSGHICHLQHGENRLLYFYGKLS